MSEKKRGLRRRLKHLIRRGLIKIALYTIPYAYYCYIRFVWMTSKVFDRTEIPMDLITNKEPHKIVTVLWHQDVFCIAWAYRKFQPTTMTSVGDAGDILARILKLCNYSEIWRGGSSKGRKRHVKILDEFIAYFKEAKYRGAGIAVDGSSGPPYRMKRGALVIAKECQCPITIARIWCKRKILLPTWDRTMIPLPFNKIIIYVHGPYWPPADLDQPEKFEQYRQYIENELLELTHCLFHHFEQKVPESCAQFFPPGWKPSWPQNKEGKPRI